MKTIAQIQTEIDSLIEESHALIFTDYKKKSKRKKEIVERVKFLRAIKLYIETNPSADFLQKEISRLTEKISLIEAIGEKKIVGRKNYDKYAKEQNLPQFKKQLETYQFIWNQ